MRIIRAMEGTTDQQPTSIADEPSLRAICSVAFKCAELLCRTAGVCVLEVQYCTVAQSYLDCLLLYLGVGRFVLRQCVPQWRAGRRRPRASAALGGEPGE